MLTLSLEKLLRCFSANLSEKTNHPGEFRSLVTHESLYRAKEQPM